MRPMGCTVSAPAATTTMDATDTQSAINDQLPLLQGVLVISPGHRVAAASRCTNPPREAARRVNAASLSA